MGIYEKLNAINGEEDDDKKYNLAKEAERVVSVTGEGIGDVEAIHGAQVGLAMGSGCSATKANA